ncbi:MAG: hypothetical protein ACLU30_01155 [Odoribacter splanchnicus]
MKTKRILLVGIAFISITLGLTALRNDDKSFEISKQLNIYATLFRDVNMFYVDEVNPGDLVTTGIKAMLKSLDPYTVYYPESEMEDVKLMTTGEYAGIGSVISKKEIRSLSGSLIKILLQIKPDYFPEISSWLSTEFR